eukprot:757991-Hanusia_phi.AAC.21
MPFPLPLFLFSCRFLVYILFGIPTIPGSCGCTSSGVLSVTKGLSLSAASESEGNEQQLTCRGRGLLAPQLPRWWAGQAEESWRQLPRHGVVQALCQHLPSHVSTRRGGAGADASTRKMLSTGFPCISVSSFGVLRAQQRSSWWARGGESHLLCLRFGRVRSSAGDQWHSRGYLPHCSLCSSEIITVHRFSRRPVTWDLSGSDEDEICLEAKELEHLIAGVTHVNLQGAQVSSPSLSSSRSLPPLVVSMVSASGVFCGHVSPRGSIWLQQPILRLEELLQVGWEGNLSFPSQDKRGKCRNYRVPNAQQRHGLHKLLGAWHVHNDDDDDDDDGDGGGGGGDGGGGGGGGDDGDDDDD